MQPPSDVLGIVLRRSPRQLAAEPFYGEFIGGLEEAVAVRGLQVLMQVVDGMPRELESYRRWASDGAVRGVVLVDLLPDDPRPDLISELGLPGIILGSPETPTRLATVRTDGRAAMRDAVARLAELGHTRIGRVTGPSRFVHTRERNNGYLDASAALGVSTLLMEGDYSAESGAEATRRLLEEPLPPTAIVYDNDTMAIAGLEAVQALGVSVPESLSILAWDDSQFCRLTSPPMSAMSYDEHARGALAGRLLLSVLDDQRPDDVVTDPPVLVERGTTAPPHQRTQRAARAPGQAAAVPNESRGRTAHAPTETGLDLEVVAIGGGFSHATPDLFDVIRAQTTQHHFEFVRRVRVVPSGLSGDGPLIGAPALIYCAGLLPEP
jgi:DNA-binding LacI/PurR family transcriptional regulator